MIGEVECQRRASPVIDPWGYQSVGAHGEVEMETARNVMTGERHLITGDLEAVMNGEVDVNTVRNLMTGDHEAAVTMVNNVEDQPMKMSGRVGRTPVAGDRAEAHLRAKSITLEAS